MTSRFFLLLLLVAAGRCLASDADALALADVPSPPSEVHQDWHFFVEAALGQQHERSGGAAGWGRLSLDLSLERALNEKLRLLFSSRLDLRQNEGGDSDSINTLKEAYVSVRPTVDFIADAGRVNARYGVATGYNPTDFFRAHAVRSLISVDPETLRQNRLGSVMLRGQRLWDCASFTALYSPRLQDKRSQASFSPDLGATNDRHRYLLSASRRLAPGFTPELVLYGVEGSAPTLGLNQTLLLGDATVLHAEWSGGRGPSLQQQALQQAQSRRFHSRLASGFSYTSPFNDTVTVEYHYNHAAPDAAGWDQLRQAPELAWQSYRAFALENQELPTRQALFLHYRRSNAGMSGLSLAAMLRYDLADRSSLHWMQARYSWKHHELAAQLQLHAGESRTVFGGAGQKSILEVTARLYF